MNQQVIYFLVISIDIPRIPQNELGFYKRFAPYQQKAINQELTKRFQEQKIQGWYLLLENIAQFIASAYSKKLHYKIKNDIKNQKYLETIRRKKAIGSEDVSTLTPIGQAISEYLIKKENQRVASKELPILVLRKAITEGMLELNKKKLRDTRTSIK